MLKRSFMIIILSLALTLPAFAEEMYVRARSARVTVEQGLGGTAVATLSRGDAVEVVSTDGRWVKVAVDGKEGWVASLLLTSRAIAAPERESTYADSDAPKARVRASSYQTAAAARGLSDENRQRLDEFGTGNFEGLATMETFRPSEEELEAFIEEEGR